MNPVRRLRPLIPVLAQLGFTRGIPSKKERSMHGRRLGRARLFSKLFLPAPGALLSARVLTRRIRLNSKFTSGDSRSRLHFAKPLRIFPLYGTLKTFPQVCMLMRAIHAPLTQKPQLDSEDQSCTLPGLPNKFYPKQAQIDDPISSSPAIIYH